MKLAQTNNSNLNFPSLWKNYSLLLLLVGISVKSFGQVYVSENTKISIQKGTVVHISENTTDVAQKTRIYVSENAKITNLSSDSLVQIVYLEKEKQPQKAKKEIYKKDSKIPLQPPMMKKDTEPERKSVLSFNARGKSPASSLLYAGQTSTVAFINTGNFNIKSFSQSKANNNSIHTFFLNEVQPIRTAFTDVYLQHQIHLENQITRPPPILIS